MARQSLDRRREASCGFFSNRASMRTPWSLLLLTPLTVCALLALPALSLPRTQPGPASSREKADQSSEESSKALYSFQNSMKRFTLVNRETFGQDLEVNPYILCIITVPWCSASQRLMREIERELSRSSSPFLSKLSLRWINYHTEKSFLTLTQQQPTQQPGQPPPDVALPIIQLIQQGLTVPYAGPHGAPAVLQAASHGIQLSHSPFLTPVLSSWDDLVEVSQGSEDVVLLLDVCGWTEEVWERRNKRGRHNTAAGDPPRRTSRWGGAGGAPWEHPQGVGQQGSSPSSPPSGLFSNLWGPPPQGKAGCDGGHMKPRDGCETAEQGWGSKREVTGPGGVGGASEPGQGEEEGKAQEEVSCPGKAAVRKAEEDDALAAFLHRKCVWEDPAPPPPPLSFSFHRTPRVVEDTPGLREQRAFERLLQGFLQMAHTSMLSPNRTAFAILSDPRAALRILLHATPAKTIAGTQSGMADQGGSCRMEERPESLDKEGAEEGSGEENNWLTSTNWTDASSACLLNRTLLGLDERSPGSTSPLTDEPSEACSPAFLSSPAVSHPCPPPSPAEAAFHFISRQGTPWAPAAFVRHEADRVASSLARWRVFDPSPHDLGAPTNSLLQGPNSSYALLHAWTTLMPAAPVHEVGITGLESELAGKLRYKPTAILFLDRASPSRETLRHCAGALTALRTVARQFERAAQQDYGQFRELYRDELWAALKDQEGQGEGRGKQQQAGQPAGGAPQQQQQGEPGQQQQPLQQQQIQVIQVEPGQQQQQVQVIQLKPGEPIPMVVAGQPGMPPMQLQLSPQQQEQLQHLVAHQQQQQHQQLLHQQQLLQQQEQQRLQQQQQHQQLLQQHQQQPFHQQQQQQQLSHQPQQQQRPLQPQQQVVVPPVADAQPLVQQPLTLQLQGGYPTGPASISQLTRAMPFHGGGARLANDVPAAAAAAGVSGGGTAAAADGVPVAGEGLQPDQKEGKERERVGTGVQGEEQPEGEEEQGKGGEGGTGEGKEAGVGGGREGVETESSELRHLQQQQQGQNTGAMGKILDETVRNLIQDAREERRSRLRPFQGVEQDTELIQEEGADSVEASQVGEGLGAVASPPAAAAAGSALQSQGVPEQGVGEGEGQGGEVEEAEEEEEGREEENPDPQWHQLQQEEELMNWHRRVAFVYVEGEDRLRSRFGLHLQPLPSLTVVDPLREEFFNFPGLPTNSSSLHEFLSRVLAGEQEPSRAPVREEARRPPRVAPPVPWRNTGHRPIAGVPRASAGQIRRLVGLGGVPAEYLDASLPSAPLHAPAPSEAAAARAESGLGMGTDRDPTAGTAAGVGSAGASTGSPDVSTSKRQGTAASGVESADMSQNSVGYCAVLFTVPWCGFCRRAEVVFQEVHRSLLFFSEKHKKREKTKGRGGAIGGPGAWRREGVRCDDGETLPSGGRSEREGHKGQEAGARMCSSSSSAREGASSSEPGMPRAHQQSSREGSVDSEAGMPSAYAVPDTVEVDGVNVSLPLLLQVDCSLSDCRRTLMPLLTVPSYPLFALLPLFGEDALGSGSSGTLWATQNLAGTENFIGRKEGLQGGGDAEKQPEETEDTEAIVYDGTVDVVPLLSFVLNHTLQSSSVLELALSKLLQVTKRPAGGSSSSFEAQSARRQGGFHSEVLKTGEQRHRGRRDQRQREGHGEENMVEQQHHGTGGKVPPQHAAHQGSTHLTLEMHGAGADPEIGGEALASEMVGAASDDFKAQDGGDFLEGSEECRTLNEPTEGSFLVATEGLVGNDIFSQSVVLLLSLNVTTGPLGLLLTHPLLWGMVQGLQQELKVQLAPEGPLSLGGPIIHPWHAFHVLTRRRGFPGFREVSQGQGLFWGEEDGFVTAMGLIERGEATPKDFWFFLGFSGWLTQQLKDEIQRGSWYIANCSSRVIRWPRGESLGKERESHGASRGQREGRRGSGEDKEEASEHLQQRREQEGSGFWSYVLEQMGKSPEDLLRMAHML